MVVQTHSKTKADKKAVGRPSPLFQPTLHPVNDGGRQEQRNLGGLSDTDKYLQERIDQTSRPTSTAGTSPASVLLRGNDVVQVSVWVGCYEHTQPDEFVDPSEWTLNVRVEVPPDSGFNMSYRRSPVFTLDTFFGLQQDNNAPHWVAYHRSPPPFFWIPRCEAVDLVHLGASLKWNVLKKEQMAIWCKAMTRGSTADGKILAMTYPQDPPPRPVKYRIVLQHQPLSYLAQCRRKALPPSPLPSPRRVRVPLRDITHLM
ncbi:hypothetical protein NMY22_g15324 [Coprinellus aureogranulatus]|nr:hypothetical protein NMY22_g15324 [Coprinellus aureogranulatus]